MRVRLQGQPVDLLSMLIEHAGEVVTRDELQKRLWAAETYVDFEHSLNAAMKRLRAVLGDSAQSPRFIETLARRGYRFIAPLNYPAEVKTETPAREPATQPVKRRQPTVMTAIALAVILAATGIMLANAYRGAWKGSGPIRALAVLPLANLSQDRDEDYFVDGMTDALRHHLQGISALRVISRTSSMHYRGSGKSLPEIGRELKVDAVVDGSVLRSGQHVRINVELTEARTDRRLWSQSYEGDLRDMFALQASVAAKIAGEIQVTLTEPERTRLTDPHAAYLRVTPDAYEAYAKGRYLWNKRTAADLKRAIGFFQQAIDKDPEYALAYDGVADSWIPLGWYGYLAPSETFPRAQAAIEKALALDDSLAEAHTSLAFVKLYYIRDWTGAEREFRRAIELNPNYANAHHWYGEFLSLVGRHKEAIAESERARELDPLSNIINAWVSSRYFYARQYDRAIQDGRNPVEMDPNFGPARLVLGQAYEQKGMLNEAIREFEKATSLEKGSMYEAALAHAYGAAGRRDDAVRVVKRLEQMSESGFVSSYDLAIAHLTPGNEGRVFELLEAAVRERSPRVAFLGVDPRFDGLRGDARFRALLQSLGLQLR